MHKRLAHGHRLDRRQGKSFRQAAQHHDIAHRNIRSDVPLESSDHDVVSYPAIARAGLDCFAQASIAYHQDAGPDARAAQQRKRVDQFQMVLFRGQSRRNADHEIRFGKSERVAQPRAVRRARPVAERLGVDAVVDHLVATREHAAQKPAPPLLFTDKDRAVRGPEEQAVEHHLELLFGSDQGRVIRDNQRNAPARKSQREPGIHQRIGIGGHDHGRPDAGDVRLETRQRTQVQISGGAEAKHRSRFARPNAVDQVGLSVLDMDHVALVPARHQAIRDGYRVALGPAGIQRPRDKNRAQHDVAQNRTPAAIRVAARRMRRNNVTAAPAGRRSAGFKTS